ncbi:MAG: penicillin acylase family protein [Bacteroidota bacterium]|uniref:Penicillin acylase family protein n=1 Tax=Flagellimonas profundi TaxID=2915620 RepID=A0ABS3FEX0_9FLAO|nr:penicillin acylase family protein [Allomuricauda profundi]MBO0341126.1 penicillin acylase family protein [Allomuricauda profundi]MEC7771006.1 penicillin acylase family protein [Bacteroidota bacterium]
MKKYKKILLVLAGFILLVAIGIAIFINSLKPDYGGKKSLPGISEEVTTYFDPYGIPHIYAENEIDAVKALGYVHAQDRLWQMELLRRVAKGRLSEVFGKDMVKTDKFFLSLGIDDHTKETISSLDDQSEAILLSQAYLQGVNEFIKNGPTPVEFYLTGIEKEPFTIEDVYNAVGYMAFSFAMAHKTDPLLTSLHNKLGEEYLSGLAISSDTSTVWIKNYKGVDTDTLGANITASVTAALDKLPVPQFEGSNSWVVAPQKTKNGKVILANDPHIGFAQPSVWYEAHVSTPTYEKYGYHLAGVPFPLLGHDRNLAYGLTMFENDDIDFYYEETNPSDSTQYKTVDGWGNYEFVNKTIKVKDGDDVTFTYKKTHHGPVLNNIADQISGERPVAMSWMYTKPKNMIMHALYGLSHATNMEEFKGALPNIHAPGLNVMYGDAEGNVAWWATAKLYEMPDSLSTKFILDGASGNEEPLRFLDFSENPMAENPPWNYVYSANNQPDSIAGMLYPGYYLPENRAKRIVSLLDSKDDWDKEAISKMILDVTSPVNTEVVSELIKLFDVTHFTSEQLVLLDSLKNWNGKYSLNTTSPVIYHRTLYYIVKNTMEDEMGPEMFKQFLSTHLFKRQIAWGANMENGKWWDNVNTPDVVETREDIVLMSFKQTWESLVKDFGEDTSQWTWDKVHTLEHQHPFGQVESLRKYFNVGPFPVEGTREVINNLAFPYDGTGFYKVNSGPSTRRIIDFSDIENSISILPTGQSGNPLSKHYDDQAEMYVKGEFRKMMMNKEEIEEKAESVLIFR